MKKYQDSLALRASVLAVRGALITLAMVPSVFAADAVDLTTPTNHVEMGLTNADKSSYKFGEYNGLQDKGLTVDAGFDVRGGSAYTGTGTTRFSASGTNLGTDNRNLSAEFGEQGRFRLNFGYDELRHNSSDTFQSPYNGLGTNNLTLPRTWLTPLQLNVNPNSTVAGNANGAAGVLPSINARVLDPAFVAADSVYRFNNTANNGTLALFAPTAAMLNGPFTTGGGTFPGMNTVGAIDRALYKSFDVYTTRKKYDAGFGVELSTQWNLRASVRHEVKDGTQLRDAASRNTNADTAMTMPVAINQTTDQYEASVNFRDAKSHLTLAYYGSLFKNADDIMTYDAWQNGFLVPGPLTSNPYGPFSTNVISTGAPSNQFHQFKLTGGYDFSKTTKLAVNASFSRNTQNQSFESEELKWSNNAANSLNGLVVTKALALKLTAKPVKDLGLTASYKYNDRDNRTAISTYAYDDVGESNSGTKSIWAGVGSGIYKIPATLLGSAININSNRPYSRKTQDLNLEANYNLNNGQSIKAGYDWQKIDRECSGTWISCADAPTSKENRLRLEWRATLTEDINASVGYVRSERRADYNEYAWLALVPMAQYINTAAAAAGVTQSAYAAMLATGFNGWGPLAGFPMTAGVASTAAQQVAAYGVNRNYYWANNNVMPAQIGYGNVNVIYEPPGFRRYYAASRDQDRLRTKLDWQLSERVSVDGSIDYTNDKYPDTVYGMTTEKSWAVNLGASFKANDDLTANAFYTHDERNQSDGSNARGSNTSASAISTATNGLSTGTAISPDGGCVNAAGVVTNTLLLRNLDQKLNSCGNWSSDRTDKTNTFGLTLKQKNLAGGKLDLSADLMWAHSKSDNNVNGGTWANNPLPAGGSIPTVAALFIPATPLPTYIADTYTIKLAGHYKLDKTSAVRLGYSYNYMKVTDWQVGDLSIGGGLTGVLPSNEKAPDFKVQTISAAYIYSFK